MTTTKKKYRDAITKLGFERQVDAGEFLGVSPRTSQRYASGDIPHAVSMLFAVMIKHGLTPDDVNKIMSGK